MLTIRKEQMEVLSRAQEEGFINDLCIMRRVNFQNKRVNCRIKMYATISQQAIEKSKHYGITEKADVCRYLNFMFIYGFDFDEEEQWAKDILNNPHTKLGETKMLELHEAALKLP